MEPTRVDRCPERPSIFDEVAAGIQQALIDHAIPSLTVAVAQHGEVLWEEGFGWANREAMIPAGEHTMYSLASISKPITATALMILVERGLIDLDRPVNDYLGDAPVRAHVGMAAEATVRRVASHTAGLPVHYHFFYADEPATPPPMAETIRRYGYLMTPPGERFIYSNLGYGILDHVVSRVAQMPYADFLRQEVFLPLGMTRSALSVPPELTQYAAARYGSDGVSYPMYRTDHPGASEVYASAHDLVRFGMYHLKQKVPDQKAILSPQTIDSMQVDTGCDEGDSNYGIGWGLGEQLGFQTVDHNGGMGGVATLLWMIPSEELVVVVLTNSSWAPPFIPSRTVGDIIGALLPSFRERQAAQRAEREKEEPEEKLERDPVTVPSALLGEWHGTLYTYEQDFPITLWLKPSGDIHAQIGNQLVSLVNNVTLTDGVIGGTMLGTMPTGDAQQQPHTLKLSLLRPRGDLLTGVLTAEKITEWDGGAPRSRTGNGLSHWIALRQV